MKRLAKVVSGSLVLAMALAATCGCQPSKSAVATGAAGESAPVASKSTASAAGTAAPGKKGDDSFAGLERDIKVARDKVYPATVRVEARKTEYFGGQKKQISGTGSGVIFDKEGHVLTNFHVAGRAKEISCTLFNKERVKARLVGADPWTDLAVLQLDLEECAKKACTFQFASFGDSDLMSEGDHVLAIGSPYGLSRSISNGIISCHDRILGESMDLGGGLESGLFSTWIQTDAAINPGNSGGPLVNMQGEVIGINTRGGGNELGFAVPINVAKDVVAQILAGGKVMRSTVGFRMQPLQDLEEFFVVSKTEGAVIASIEPDSPADAAGVKAQDILLEVDGQRVKGRYPEELFDLRRLISSYPVGQSLKLKLKRAGKELELAVTTAELTTVRSDEINFESWGFVGQNVTKRLAERENLKDTQGVYLTGVRTGETADKAKLEEGDVITRFGTTDIADAEQLKKLYDESIEKKDKMVLLLVRRGQAMLPKILTVNYPDATPPAAVPALDAVKPPTTEPPAEKPEAKPEAKPETKPTTPLETKSPAAESKVHAETGPVDEKK